MTPDNLHWIFDSVLIVIIVVLLYFLHKSQNEEAETQNGITDLLKENEAMRYDLETLADDKKKNQHENIIIKWKNKFIKEKETKQDI